MDRGLFDVPIFKTIAETAKITGLSKYYLRKGTLNNTISHIKSGKKVLINVNKLIEQLKSTEHKEN